MLSAHQISGFLNRLFLHCKLMKQPHFLHVDTNSQKSKVDRKHMVGHGQNWVQPVCSWDYEIDFI